MSGGLVIRDAADSDIARIQAIYTPYVLHGLATFEEVVPSVEELHSRRAAILARGMPYLVAEWNGEVVGYSYASAYRPRVAYQFTVEDSVYLAPEFQRRGIGTSLLAALIERCRRTPARQMVAIIGDSGNQGSITLHERLGFRHVGVLQNVGFKLGRWVDTVLMQRALTP